MGRDSGVGTARGHFTDPTAPVGLQGVVTVQKLINIEHKERENTHQQAPEASSACTGQHQALGPTQTTSTSRTCFEASLQVSSSNTAGHASPP